MQRSNKRKLPPVDDEDDSDTEYNPNDDEMFSSSDDESSDESCDESCDEVSAPATTEQGFSWKDVPITFSPRKEVPVYKEPETTIDKDTSIENVFLKLFPKSLFIWIADCTNERLKILSEKKNKKIKLTDANEIMVVTGCLLVMSYNRVPHMQMYWSKNPSLHNETIASAISRDRFMLIHSKLYFNHPKKPNDAGRTYYMDEMVDCLVHTFNRYRTEATFQSIDEFMVKFEGRTVLKQFQPIKPTRVGVKGYARADAVSGYLYDFYIFKGAEKKTEAEKGTSGERVVTTLCKTIREKDVAIINDRFFTSVKLVHELDYACVGTVISTRKYLPDLTGKFPRGTNGGVICYKWQDVKEVMLLSNCHEHKIGKADRRQKDGILKTFDCPEAINFYNEFMAGVDRADQYSTCYDINRKTNKWWKRVFYRLLQIAVSNSWIIFKKFRSKEKPLITFLIPLSENLIQIGKLGMKNTTRIKAGTGPPSKRLKAISTVIEHQPIRQATKRRCTFCATKKKQGRTFYICSTCNIPLCVDCFAPCHGHIMA